MAHWAKIDDNGIVENVIVTANEGDEGEDWIAQNLEGTWVKTSYNTRAGKHLLGGDPLRKNFAQPGWKYDYDLDCFIPPKTEGQEDFILDPETCLWVSAL